MAAAYFYQARGKWESSYTLQFVNGAGRPIIPEGQQEGFEFDPDAFVPLPSGPELQELPTLSGRDQTPFMRAIVALEDYRQSGARGAT